MAASCGTKNIFRSIFRGSIFQSVSTSICWRNGLANNPGNRSSPWPVRRRHLAGHSERFERARKSHRSVWPWRADWIGPTSAWSNAGSTALASGSSWRSRRFSKYRLRKLSGAWKNCYGR